LARSVSIIDRPAAPHFVRFPAGTPARFLVTIDTEEEFDWGAPLRREGHGLATISSFARFVQFCESFDVVPLFLVDYPIATAPATAEVLGPALAAGRAEIGVHLHPWVNPPFDEDLSEFNSFPGNLPEAMEHEKFHDLHEAIRTNLGVAPQIYRAGRYGAGPNTAAILRKEGIAIDTSVRALFDYSSNGGPNYRDHPCRPYWLDADQRLVELPVTTVYGGLLRRWGTQIYPQLWRGPRLRGAMAHTRLLERIPLTPEGITAAEAKRGIDAALAEKLPLLNFSFHSPSLAPGHTPYVRTAADLDAFYDWWREIFAHLARRDVVPSSVRDLAASLGLSPPALAEPALA